MMSDEKKGGKMFRKHVLEVLELESLEDDG